MSDSAAATPLSSRSFNQLTDAELGELVDCLLAHPDVVTNVLLRVLSLNDNQSVDRTRVEAAFVDALRLNPNRPTKSRWCLYSINAQDTDYKRLKHAAELGHPSLQSLLLAMTFDQTSNKNTKPASSSCIMW